MLLEHKGDILKGIKKAEIMEKLEASKGMDKMLAVREWIDLEAGDAVRNFRRLSDAPVIRRIDSEALRMVNVLEDALSKLQKSKGPMNVWPVADEDFSRKVALEFAGGDSEDEAAKAVFAELKKTYDGLLDRMEKAGVYVNRKDNHLVRVHNNYLIEQDFEGWTKYLQENLDATDLAKAMPAGSVVGENLTDSGAAAAADYIKKSLQLNDLSYGMSGQIITMPQKLKFKTAAAEAAYFERYAGVSFFDATIAELQALSKKAILAEQFGPKWKETLSEIIDDTSKLAVREGANRGKVDALVKNSLKLMDELGSDMSRAHNPTLATVARMARNWNTMRLLGKTVLYTGVDFVIASWSTRKISDAGWFGQIKQLADNTFGDPAVKEALKEWGFAQNILNATVFDRFSPIGNIVSGGSGIDNAFNRGAAGILKYTGVTNFTIGMQRSTGGIYLRSIAKYSGKSFSDLAELSPTLHRRMKNFGLSEDTWKAISDPSVVRHGMISNELITNRNAAEALNAFLLREVNIAVTHPDAMTHALLKGKKGEYAGESWMLATQYQTFGLGFMRGAMARAKDEGIGSTLQLILPLFAMGVLKAQADRMLNGKELYPWDSPLLMTDGLDKSGIMYLAGSFAKHATHSQFHTGSVDIGGFIQNTVAGPTFGFGAQLGTDVFDRMASSGNPTREAAANARIAQTFFSGVPAKNLVYWNWMVTKAINDFAEDIDPNRTMRRIRREHKERSSGF